MTDQPPPPGGYPPPPQGGNYPPPQGGNYPPPGGYPPPQQPGNYPPPPPQQPQQGGYPPPPQQGGYPPPPPPGYGAPPPGYGAPPPGYGAPPPPGAPAYGVPPSFDIGTAFSWSWNKFSKNVAALVVPTLVYGLIIAVVFGIFFGIAIALAPSYEVPDYGGYGSSYDYDYDYSFGFNFGFASIAVLVLGFLVMFVVGGAIQSAYTSGLLELADGQPVQVGSFFRPRNVGAVVVASLIVGVATVIGTALCYLPGLIVGLFTMFTTVVLLDRNLKPVDAIKASIDIVKNNIGQSIIAYLLAGVIASVGVVVCYVGALVSVPVAQLFLIYAYRKLSGGQVAPLTP